MSAVDVLAQARSAGVELLIHNGKLASRGPATPELRDAIRVHRPALVALLTGKRAPASPVLPPLPDDDEHARWLRGDRAPIAWTDRPDVVTVVEDLADEGLRPSKIARTLGLRPGEVITILRRTGR